MLEITARRALPLVLTLLVTAPVAGQQAVRLPVRDVALQERPAAVFTVGTEEGRDWEMFSDIRTVAFDRSDNLYILDGQNYRVVVFDARGRYVRHFGKRGGGPGELQAPLSLIIGGDGNVVVNDVGNRAFVVFAPTGEHVRNVPFPGELGFPGTVFGDGRGGVVTRMMPRLARQAGGAPPAPGTGQEFASIVRLPLQERATLTQLYRMPIPPAHQQDVPGGSSTERRRVAIRMDPIFGPGQLFTTLPGGGLAVQHESPFSVKVLDASGRAVRTITREYPLRRVTQKDKEAWEELRDSGDGPPARTISVAMTAGGASSVSIGGASNRPAEAMRIELDDVPFADAMAVVTGMRSDPQGRLWIQRRHPNATSQGPIDLVTAEGRYIGTLAPQPLPDAVSASGLAAWIVRDDLGVERVSVRRLPANWR